MSSIHEKLKHFTEVILKDAALERNRILEQIRTETEERVNLEKRKFKEAADGFFKKEVASAESEKNNIISNAIIQSRQLLMKAREEIIETVFADVKKKLVEFVIGEEYFPYLSRQIKHSCDLAGEGELSVYVSKKDMERFSSLFEDIKKELPSCTVFREIDEDIIGGCRVLNNTRNIIVDNTLLGKLESNRENFLEVCDLRID